MALASCSHFFFARFGVSVPVYLILLYPKIDILNPTPFYIVYYVIEVLMLRTRAVHGVTFTPIFISSTSSLISSRCTMPRQESTRYKKCERMASVISWNVNIGEQRLTKRKELSFCSVQVFGITFGINYRHQ